MSNYDVHAVVPRNARQIYNFKANRQNEAKDDVLCLVESLLEQSNTAGTQYSEKEYSLGVPSALQCSGHPGNI